MQPVEENESLARHIARAVESGWDDYWEFERRPTTSVEAASRARMLYELAGSVQYDTPDDWSDPGIIDAALLMLVTYGDGYLLAFGDSPDEIANEALPDLTQSSWFFDRSGLRAWCDNQGGESAPEDTATTASDADDKSERPLINSSLDKLRENERPEAEFRDMGYTVVATELHDWLSIYSTWLADIQSNAAETLPRLREKRSSYAAQLAWVRVSLARYSSHGASAEGIAALSLIANILRSLLLGGMATDAPDLLRMPLAPMAEIHDIMHRFELSSWPEQSRPQT